MWYHTSIAALTMEINIYLKTQLKILEDPWLIEKDIRKKKLFYTLISSTNPMVLVQSSFFVFYH